MITTFDGHIHVPRYRVNATLLAAVRNGLDSLMFTDRNNTDIFDSLRDGSLVLDDFAIHPVSARYLIAYSDEHSVDIYRGQEPRTKQGDVLVWGGSKAVEPGRDIIYTIQEANKDGAHVVLAHPFFSKGSVGSSDPSMVEELLNRFSASDLSLEINAQFPSPLFSVNDPAYKVARATFRNPWYNSDTHGHHVFEHRKVGQYLHNQLYEPLGDDPHLALRELGSSTKYGVFGPGMHTRGGRTAKAREVIFWNLHSALKDPVGKVRDVLGLNKKSSF